MYSVEFGGGEGGRERGEKVIPLSACPNKTGDVQERGLDETIKEKQRIKRRDGALNLGEWRPGWGGGVQRM